MLPLLSLALDSAVAAEPVEVSCDTVAQHEVRDQSCATQAALSEKLKEAFPGKEVVIQDLGDKGMQGNKFLIDVSEGPFITVKFSERDGSCRYAAAGSIYPPIWYPSLENLRDEKTTDFQPEPHGIDLSAVWDAEEALGIYTTDSTEEDTPYTKTYKDFHLMVAFLRTSIKVGQEKGWGDGSSISGIQRVSNLGRSLSREDIKRDILSSGEFKELSPVAQKVFTDYVENKGAVITALGQMEPIMHKCAGKRPNEPLPFYQ